MLTGMDAGEHAEGKFTGVRMLTSVLPVSMAPEIQALT
jgi:hypothetical protein